VSKESVAKVVQRAISDGAFRRQLTKDPTGALRGFDLTPAETAAIRSGDSGRLSALGVDLRMSKAFALSGNESGNDVGSNVVSSDLGTGNTGALSAGDGASTSGALTGGGGATDQGMLTSGGGNAFGNAALISGDSSDTDPMISSGDGGREGVVIPGDPAHAFGVVTGSDGGTALPDETDQYAPQFNSSTHDVIVSDDGGSGAQSPGEAGDGPEIQP
jgi:hypothetical protein